MGAEGGLVEEAGNKVVVVDPVHFAPLDGALALRQILPLHKLRRRRHRSSCPPLVSHVFSSDGKEGLCFSPHQSGKMIGVLQEFFFKLSFLVFLGIKIASTGCTELW